MIGLLPPSLKVRSLEPELMDDLGSDSVMLESTLKQFSLINPLFSGSERLIRRYLIKHMRQNPKEVITILDIGAGGGDITRSIADTCAKEGIKIEIHALDPDKRAVDYALRNSGGYSNIKIIQGDIKEYTGYKDLFDYTFANHFLHHIDEASVREVMKTISDISRCGFLVNDIKRSRAAYYLFTLVSSLMFRNSFAAYDGKLSIKKGFTEEELKRITEDISGKEVSVSSTLPWRVFCYWLNNQDSSR
ncbi:MAG: methyltransferase domain-containing protein [Chitinivibrionales bacterium]